MAVSYDVEDRSVLLPFFKRWVWQPALRIVPESFAANDLTLLGTLCSAIAFLLVAFIPATRWSLGAAGVLVFVYLTLDNIDGAQARRTGTSSPLGEFLDHWLDALNLSFLFLGTALTWKLSADRSVLVMVLAALSYGMTFWEQRITGRVFMGRIGNIEGVVSVAGFYIAGAVFGPDRVRETVLVFGMTAIDLLYFATVIGTIATVIGPAMRVRQRLLEPLALFSPVIVTVAWYVIGAPSYKAVCFLMMLFPAILAGRMLIARVMAQKSVEPDPVLLYGLPVLATIALILHLPVATQSVLVLALLFYSAVRVLFDFLETVRALKQHVRDDELLARLV